MSRDGDGGVREGVMILSLVAAYPTHQFFDIAIDIHTCDRCGACAAQCPEQCISFSEDGIEIESGRCTGCQLCRRSEEHTSELQSLMRISYAVFCLKKKKKSTTN